MGLSEVQIDRDRDRDEKAKSARGREGRARDQECGDNREYFVITYDNMYHNAMLSTTQSCQTMAVRILSIYHQIIKFTTFASGDREATAVFWFLSG